MPKIAKAYAITDAKSASYRWLTRLRIKAVPDY